MSKLTMTLTALQAQAEGNHRTAQVTERYGQAAYNQGKRDAFRQVLALLADGMVVDARPESAPAPATAATVGDGEIDNCNECNAGAEG